VTKFFVTVASLASVVALAGGATALGTDTVGASLTFAWPTSIDVAGDGSLVLVENGANRVVRVQPATRGVTVIASGLAKPYAAVEAQSGAILLSNGHLLQRLAAGRTKTLARAAEDIGPIAIARDGRIYYTDATHVFVLARGRSRAIASRVDNPHGISVAPDGAVLVSDTGHNRVLRIGPHPGRVATLIRTAQPRGLAVAPDGTVYVVEGGAKRVGRYSPAGVRLGSVGPRYHDPYDVAVAAHGVAFVLETAASGSVWRIAADGAATTL